MKFSQLFHAELLARGFSPADAAKIEAWYNKDPLNTPFPVLTNAICLSADWDESKHKRASDGKFTSGMGGGGNGHSEDAEWRRIGKQSIGEVTSPKLKRLREKMQADSDAEKLMERAMLQFTPEQREKYERIQDRRKRQEAELVRQAKHRQRVQREKELANGLANLERQLDELENHIDYLEEGFADRNGGSTKSFDFPSPEAKAEYEDSIRQRDELETRLREIKSLLRTTPKHVASVARQLDGED